jgi:hypothetical protein
VLLKGVGLDVVWRETAVLAAFSLGLLAVSVRKFSKTL